MPKLLLRCAISWFDRTPSFCVSKMPMVCFHCWPRQTTARAGRCRPSAAPLMCLQSCSSTEQPSTAMFAAEAVVFLAALPAMLGSSEPPPSPSLSILLHHPPCSCHPPSWQLPSTILPAAAAACPPLSPYLSLTIPFPMFPNPTCGPCAGTIDDPWL